MCNWGLLMDVGAKTEKIQFFAGDRKKSLPASFIIKVE